LGVNTRDDSPFYQLWLEGAGPGGRGKREATRIRIDAPTGDQRKENRQLAESLYHQRMTALARGVVLPQDKPAITFNTFADWFEEHKLPKRRGQEREREILKRLRAELGTLQLRAIDRQRVEEYTTLRLTTPTLVRRSKRTAPRTVHAGPSTVNREVDLLKAILQAAVPRYLQASPLYGMKRLPTITPKRRLMTDAEERRLLRVMAPDDKALFLIGEDSLVRMGDVLDVKWADWHRTHLWITDPKEGGGFEVPLSKRARQAMAQIPENGTPYVFARHRRARTERDRRNGIRQMLERYCALAKPPIPFGRAHGGLTWHWATRRTGATRMLVNKVDVGTVQKIGRWKNPDVVLGIYHELIDAKARRAVDGVAPVHRRHTSAAIRTRKKPKR
jgi:hypothetical protein